MMSVVRNGVLRQAYMPPIRETGAKWGGYQGEVNEVKSKHTHEAREWMMMYRGKWIIYERTTGNTHIIDILGGQAGFNARTKEEVFEKLDAYFDNRPAQKQEPKRVISQGRPWVTKSEVVDKIQRADWLPAEEIPVESVGTVRRAGYYYYAIYRRAIEKVRNTITSPSAKTIEEAEELAIWLHGALNEEINRRKAEAA